MLNRPHDYVPGSTWHEGEVALQQELGVDERMAEIGPKVIRDFMPDQHRAFFRQLPFVVVGTVDASGDAWATLRAGSPGFLSSPDPHSLHVALARNPEDPAEQGMDDGGAIGLLGIELHTRRRNRLNGTITRSSDDAFDVAVGESFGNCPRYISVRDAEFARNPAMPTPEAARHTDRLDDAARRMIAAADTFFVASYADNEIGARRVDVSHRGGRPGFVHVSKDGVLTIPDYAGNMFFNTLGNLLTNPKAGLVFAGFDTGDLLQLSGDTEIILDSPEIAKFDGAERLWRFTPRRIAYRPDALPLRWRRPS
jgi:predicted pyridoxine 5'-phosphate oxidase superfamily flavin-nucleotide-binding protein